MAPPLQASAEPSAVRAADAILFCVKSGDTDFMVREVDTGRLSGPLVEITRGLAAGDVVVTAGAFKLKSALLAGTLADDDDDDAKEPQR